ASITEINQVSAAQAVGSLNEESGSVRAGPTIIQTDGPRLGRVVDSRVVSELPLATRNFTQILALSPGTDIGLADNTGVGRNSQNISVNGARRTQNNFQIDRKSTRLNSSHVSISYAVFCLK